MLETARPLELPGQLDENTRNHSDGNNSMRTAKSGLSDDCCVTGVLTWFFAMSVLSGWPSPVGADEYADQVLPFMETHCFGCHSTRAKEGGLDLERFATVGHVRADVEPWQAALRMLENGEMPPRGEARPPAEDSERTLAWIREFLEREARLRAGDPGPAKMRRLNNAEYRYTIRDLTGVDLHPARHFPADGAAGEGFLNAADALTISPDLLAKYLEAAKEIAAHAVLLPDGFRFSNSVFSEDHVNEVLFGLTDLHGRYANEHGSVLFDRYLRATIVNRDAIRSGNLSLTDVATSQELSLKYFRELWHVLSDGDPSEVLDEVRESWRTSAPDDIPGLVAKIATLQGLLWHKQTPFADQALEDRFVPATVKLASGHSYRLDTPSEGTADEVFFIVPQVVIGEPKDVRVVLENPRIQSGKEPAVPLRDFLETALAAVSSAGGVEDEPPAPPDGVTRLNTSRFGVHPGQGKLDRNSVLINGSEVFEVRLPKTKASERVFLVEGRLDASSAPDAVVRLFVQRSPALPALSSDLAWQYAASSPERPLLMMRDDDAARERFMSSANEFRRIFPARVCYPGVIVVDAGVTLERFHRGDSFLSRLFLDPDEQVRLDRLWEELHFISGDALQVWASIATLLQGELANHESSKLEVERRARKAEAVWGASESAHLESLLDFAARAFRRPLSGLEKRSMLEHYEALRTNELPHDDAFRAVLARVFVSPKFLYRIEQQGAGKEPSRVADRELASRLSYFLWSSLPDQELSDVAASGRLHDPEVLTEQTLRMLGDSRIRALAIEFGAQWLEVRAFDQFRGKNEELFPTFDAELRKSMYEESIRFFQDMFESDRSIEALIDADHTFLNETLATHYGIDGVQGDTFRRVNGVKKSGRGGILGLASALSKHSGASRTSPVLRGNWVAEYLLGDRLPRPPDGVPELPEGESSEGLTIRQLVEKHAEVEECAVCHKRIDPLGFALEEYDTIGRRRETDLEGRPVDARARLESGLEFEGIRGLREYLLSERKPDLVRQFCRKLLGYALGRRVLLSDRQLLETMAEALEKNDGHVSAAILAVVQSRQFTFVRGSDATRRRRF
jgi:hypothetical protein